MTEQNRQIRLAARPQGLPKPSDWEQTTEPVPEPGEGQFRVAVSHVSIDPAMRAWLNDVPSYIRPVEIGAVMRAAGTGTVTASRHPDFAEGDSVSGVFGVQEHAISDGKDTFKIDTDVAPAPTWLGMLGLSGITAYFGLLDVGQLKKGETVVISGAAGAVGSAAGQIAKIHDCRVIGIAGGHEKCAVLVDELGFDAAIDYKDESVARALRAHAPEGVDVFFDNVGGEVLDAVLTCLARDARVVISGAVSQYNASDVKGPSNYLSLLVNRASMKGFVIFDYADRYAEATVALAGWLREGRIIAKEHCVSGGVAAFPEALLGLFAGVNTGKLILEV